MPLCMLDTAGKLLEKLLELAYWQVAGDLSDLEYRFRKRRAPV